jgi:hypothetical protein
MKNIIVIAIVVAIGWYGNYLYKQHGDITQSLCKMRQLIWRTRKR